ncbi:MAG: 3-hydroxybutyryl-CoA dehydrogenase [Chloroflexi bacterium]|nr:3-hydroxybutyryl-CoA dehydrogenase [Chloroflexota bacterium]
MSNKTSGIETIGIVGAGTMGSGIALAALYAGFEVVLQDEFSEALQKGNAYIQKFLEKKDQTERAKALTLADDLKALTGCDVVIEAALEQLEVKHEIFAKLDEICGPDTILASNTSTLSVTAIAANTQHPERVAGMHFFNPAPVLPLVEVIRAAQTSDATIDALMALAEALGKTPVLVSDTPGFIVNRVARPFYGEALRLLGEGVANHAQIDQIVEQGGGFRMGPFRLMDLIGIDINAGAMRSMYEQTFGEPRYRPHPIQMQKLAEGALGRKSGRGFYTYADGQAEEVFPEIKADGGQSQLVISEGSWAPGLAELCAEAGYEVVPVADGDQKPAACIVVAGRGEEAARLVSWYDQALDPGVPLIVQCADTTLSEIATWMQNPRGLIGFDGLFLATGKVATLCALEGVSSDLRGKAEALFAALGRRVIWVGESPALVLPRIVCQLVNEAAFAELEGVVDGETIDLAMRLGVNYPQGPLEWGAALGHDKVLAVLDHLYTEYHEERYRACILLRRWAR